MVQGRAVPGPARVVRESASACRFDLQEDVMNVRTRDGSQVRRLIIWGEAQER